MNPESTGVGGTAASGSQAHIQESLLGVIAERLKVEKNTVSLDTSFDEYGIDSVAAVEISADLSELLERDLPGTLLYEFPTIKELSAHLAQENAKAR
jgi:acyl carrier protein